jgi:hypothetical protein
MHGDLSLEEFLSWESRCAGMFGRRVDENNCWTWQCECSPLFLHQVVDFVAVDFGICTDFLMSRLSYGNKDICCE